MRPVASALTSCSRFWGFPSIFNFYFQHRLCTNTTKKLDLLFFKPRLMAFIEIYSQNLIFGIFLAYLNTAYLPLAHFYG